MKRDIKYNINWGTFENPGCLPVFILIGLYILGRLIVDALEVIYCR